MRRATAVKLAAGTAVLSMISPLARATSYTWSDFTGGEYSWTDPTQWGGAGYPGQTASMGSGDSATISGAITGGPLLIDVPSSGTFYVNQLTLASSTAQTIDVGDNNAQGGTLIFDGGGAGQNQFADIVSGGVAGSTNIISAGIQLDENGFYSGSLNGQSAGSTGNYVVTVNAALNSTIPQSEQDGVFASVLVDPNSTNNLTINGSLTQAAGVSGAFSNAMTGGKTVTINGNILVNPTAATAAQAIFLAGTTGSTTILNGVIQDGNTAFHGTVTYGSTSSNKVSAYPAIDPTFVINGTNTYTGTTTLNMATLILNSPQPFGVPNTNATPTSGTGELRLGSSANEYGYNIESTTDSQVIPNGVDVGEFLTIEGQHSLTINGYMYQTTSREVDNLLPAGKSLTVNGNIFVQSTNQGRTWIFDGSGLTIVNSGILNSGAAADEAPDGTSPINGPFTKNGVGTVLINGTGSTYRGATTVNGGLLQFATSGSYGVQVAGFADPTGAFDIANPGTSGITVGQGGAVGVATGSTDPGFEALFATGGVSTGALALAAGTPDTSATLDFTTGTLSGANMVGMGVGALSSGTAFTGTIIPANNQYNLGGGGVLTLPGANQLTDNAGPNNIGSNSLLVTGGTVALNGSNSYSGITTVKQLYLVSNANKAATNNYTGAGGAAEPAELSVSTMNALGTSSTAASSLDLVGGTLQYTGSGESTNRLFTMSASGATLDASGTGAVSFTNTGAIVQSLAAAATGVTTGGTFPNFTEATLPATYDTSQLAIGMVVSDASGDGVLTPYAPVTIAGIDNRHIWLNFTPLSSFTAGASDTLTFANQNRTLTLTGSSAAANTLDSALVNADSTDTLAISKTGSGTWLLGGANTYSGGTTIGAGILEAVTTGSLPGYLTGNVSIASGATLAVAVGGAGQWAASDIDNLRSDVTFGSGTFLGIDTTSASSGFTYASNIGGVLGLTKLGSNTLTLSGNSGYSGSTNVNAGTLAIATGASITSTTLNVNPGGTLSVSGSLSASATLNDNGTTVFTPNASGIAAIKLATVNVGAGGFLQLAAGANHANRNVLITSSLSDSGLVDIGNNDMILHGGSASAVAGLIASGYHGGGWGGSTGITSSSAAATTNTAIGYELNSNGSGALVGTFDGQPVTSTDVLVKYTYFGDANLDGVVNGSDYTLIDNGFNNSLTGWHNGDFNYDGVVNGDDYTLIDNAFNTQGASLAAAPAEMIASNTSQIAGGSAAVPEPASLGMLGVAALGLMSRRRRRA